jgi:hypothetical protein
MVKFDFLRSCVIQTNLVNTTKRENTGAFAKSTFDHPIWHDPWVRTAQLPMTLTPGHSSVVNSVPYKNKTLCLYLADSNVNILF